MPPHCDSLDGPVVTAARRALDSHDVSLVLPYVPEHAEEEVTHAFDRVIEIRDQGDAARAVGETHFYETVVRLHRAGEGAPYTGLKPAGLDHGPVIPVAERAIETGGADELAALLTARVDEQVRKRLAEVLRLKERADGDVDANREYVEAMLDLQVWSHALYQSTRAAAHAGGHQHAHRH